MTLHLVTFPGSPDDAMSAVREAARGMGMTLVVEIDLEGKEDHMGLSKVKVIGPGKVKFIHQLSDDGTAYAEDVTVESDVPGRIDYLRAQDGKIGVASFSFSAYDPAPEGLKFPDETGSAGESTDPAAMEAAARTEETPTDTPST